MVEGSGSGIRIRIQEVQKHMVRTGSISLLSNIVYACTCHTKPVLRIRIRIDFGRLDPDPDPGGQKLPTKVEKSEDISCFKVLDILL
jgi:hypothetical protein